MIDIHHDKLIELVEDGTHPPSMKLKQAILAFSNDQSGTSHVGNCILMSG